MEELRTENVLTTDINESFNVEILADYLYTMIHGKRYEVLNLIDLGTRYKERMIAKSS